MKLRQKRKNAKNRLKHIRKNDTWTKKDSIGKMAFFSSREQRLEEVVKIKGGYPHKLASHEDLIKHSKEVPDLSRLTYIEFNTPKGFPNYKKLKSVNGRPIKPIDLFKFLYLEAPRQTILKSQELCEEGLDRVYDWTHVDEFYFMYSYDKTKKKTLYTSEYAKIYNRTGNVHFADSWIEKYRPLAKKYPDELKLLSIIVDSKK